MSTKHDPYCWQCHKSNTNLNCNNCMRSFHLDCLNGASGSVVNPDEWLCSLCMTLKVCEDIDKTVEWKMLPILVERIRAQYGDLYSAEIDHQWKLSTWSSNRANPESAETNVIQMFKSYENFISLKQLYSKVSSIVRNCVLLHTDINRKTDQAKSLLKYITDAINCIRNCPECFENANKKPKTWLCSNPHLIIWAKRLGQVNYWPAKVMAVDQQLVNVHFFGLHVDEKVPIDNCFLYSKERPKSSRIIVFSLTKELFKEAEEYIQNIRKKYGSFKYAEEETPFDPALLKEYVEQMIAKSQRAALDDTINLDDNDHGENEDEGHLEQSLNLVVSVASSESESTSQGLTEKAYHIDKDPRKSVKGNDATTTALNNGLKVAANEGMRQSKSMSDDTSKPPRKKARFGDEYGDNLIEVSLFETSESVQEDEQNDVAMQTEDSEVHQVESVGYTDKCEHNKEMAELKKAHLVEMSEIAKANAEMVSQLRAKLQEKETEVARIKEKQSKIEENLVKLKDLMKEYFRSN